MAQKQVHLTNLIPGQKYILRIKSVASDGTTSNWSETIPFAAIKDITPPLPVPSASIDFSTSAFIAYWNTASSKASSDFKNFKILLTASGTSTSAVYYTDSPFTLTYEANAALFGTARPSLTVQISAQDINGNISDSYTISGSNPSPTEFPTIATNAVSNGFTASWSPVTSSFIDYSYTEVYTSSVSVFNASAGTLVWRGNGTYANYSKYGTYSTLYVKARHVDIFGQPGPDSNTSSVTPIAPLVLDTNAPAAPTTGFGSSSSIDTTDISGQTAIISASWTGVSDSDLVGYYLKFSTTNNSASPGQITNVPSASGVIPVRTQFRGNAGQTYYWWVAGYDYLNNTSSWSTTSSIVVARDTTAPSTPTNLSVIVSDNVITASWTVSPTATDFNPPIGIGGYRVEFAQDLAFTAASAQTYTSLNNRISFAAPLWNKTYYARVSAFDTQGNISASSTFASVTVGTNPALSASVVALTAQSSADGKNTIFYAASASPPSASRAGDTWFVTDLDNQVRTASATGSLSWVSRPFGNSAIFANIDAGKITAGSISAGLIVANSINTGIIDATKLVADTTMINQKLRIGNSASSQVVIDSSSLGGRLYSGNGLFKDANTGFYLSSTGSFSLKDSLYFDGTRLTIAGSIVAQSGIFAGSVAAGNMWIGSNGVNSGIYINTNNYWYDSGNFNLANGSVTWNGTTLRVTGDIVAKSGSFDGNVQITQGSLYAGTSPVANPRVIFNASGVAGYNSAGTLGFSLSSLTGLLGASAGYIGGWNILPTRLYSGTGTNEVGLASDTISIWAGGASATAPFRVSNTGSVIAQSGSIGGWTIGTSTLSGGTGTNLVGLQVGTVGATSFWAGGDSITAPFRVTNTGILYASSASIAGTITSSVGTIGGWNLTGSSLWGGTVTGSYVGITTGNTTFFAGALNSTASNSKFYVTNNGSVVVTQGGIFKVSNVSSSNNYVGAVVIDTSTVDSSNFGTVFPTNTITFSTSSGTDDLGINAAYIEQFSVIGRGPNNSEYFSNMIRMFGNQRRETPNKYAYISAELNEYSGTIADNAYSLLSQNRENFVSNPSFESGSTGWTTAQTSASRSYVPGAASTILVTNTISASAIRQRTTSLTDTNIGTQVVVLPNISGSPTYYYSAYFKVPSGVTGSATASALTITLTDETAGTGFTVVTSSSTPVLGLDTWRRAYLIVQYWGVSSASRSIVARYSGTTASGLPFDQDAWMCDYGGLVMPYFDGSTTDTKWGYGAWTGASNLSKSYLPSSYGMTASVVAGTNKIVDVRLAPFQGDASGSNVFGGYVNINEYINVTSDNGGACFPQDTRVVRIDTNNDIITSANAIYSSTRSSSVAINYLYTGASITGTFIAGSSSISNIKINKFRASYLEPWSASSLLINFPFDENLSTKLYGTSASMITPTGYIPENATIIGFDYPRNGLLLSASSNVTASNTLLLPYTVDAGLTLVADSINLYANKINATGSITVSKIVAGSNITNLTSPPYAHVYSTTQTNINNAGTVSMLPMNTTVESVGEATLSSSGVVIPSSGLYHIVTGWMNNAPSTASGYVDTVIGKNGTTFINSSAWSRTWLMQAGATWAPPKVDTYLRCNAGDTINLYARTNLTLTSSSAAGTQSFIIVKWVAD